MKRVRKSIRKLEQTIEQLRAYIRELERWHVEVEMPDGWQHRSSGMQEREKERDCG